jgi:hypothetical protein
VNRDIANIIKDKISDLPFIDKISGLVRTVSYTENVEGQAYTYKFPVSCDVTYEDCFSNERYKEMTPNSELRSLVYFEDGGINLTGSNSRSSEYESRIRLVCWLNMKRFDTTECSISGYITSLIIRRLLTTTRFNNGIYSDIRFNVSQIPDKTSAIFSQYTYDESATQYMLYPYDYLAIDIKVNYSILYKCLDDIGLTNGLC